MPRKLWGGAATADARHAREVYALRDPRDNLIYYVGMSINAQKKLVEHLHGKGGSWKQRSWIKELRKLGLSPILLLLETIDAGPHAYDLATESEEFWIKGLLKDGHPLLNVDGIKRRHPR